MLKSPINNIVFYEGQKNQVMEKSLNFQQIKRESGDLKIIVEILPCKILNIWNVSLLFIYFASLGVAGWEEWMVKILTHGEVV